MPTWPSAGGFPQAPRVGTWTRQAQEIVAAFKPAVGPARIRKRVTGSVFICQGVFLVSEAERAILESFWRVDCKLGSLTFQWRDPEAPFAVRTWEWVEKPSAPHYSGDFYLASVTLYRL